MGNQSHKPISLESKGKENVFVNRRNEQSKDIYRPFGKSSFFTLTRPMLFFPMFPRILISTLGFKANNNIKRKSKKVKQATRLLLLVISSRRYKGINSHKLPSRYHQRNFLHNVTEINSVSNVLLLSWDTLMRWFQHIPNAYTLKDDFNDVMYLKKWKRDIMPVFFNIFIGTEPSECLDCSRNHVQWHKKTPIDTDECA